MSIRNKRRNCVYCGEERKLTDDHVPPKLLLATPYPANLRTVPACRTCNQSFMKNDEYIRAVVAMDLRAASNPVAQSNLPTIIRSLNRPKARGFATYLASQSQSTVTLDEHGHPFQTVQPDMDRFAAAGERLIRGIHFLELGRPIRVGALVRAGARFGLTSTSEDMLTIARAMQTTKDRGDGEVGEGFSYYFGYDEGVSMWLILLYESLFWLGTVDERHLDSRAMG